MPQWLYRIQPVRTTMLAEGQTAAEEAITEQHFQYLKDLMTQGSLILAGRTQNTDYSSFGIIIFQAETEADAWQVVNNDPAVPRRTVPVPHRPAGTG